MANVSVNDVVLVTVVGRYFGQTTMNTYPHLITATTGTPTIQETMESLNTALKATGKLIRTQQACCPADWVHSYTWCQVIRPTRYRKWVFPGVGDGTFSDEPSSTANLQATIERYAEESGRHDQGAVRLPIGTHSDFGDDGLISIALSSKMELHAQQMRATTVTSTTLGGATLRPLTGVTAPSWTPLAVFGTSVKDTIRVIRRRTVGLGI